MEKDISIEYALFILALMGNLKSDFNYILSHNFHSGIYVYECE